MSVSKVSARARRCVDITLERAAGRMTIVATTTGLSAPNGTAAPAPRQTSPPDRPGRLAHPPRASSVVVRPAFPLDARVRSVTVDGRDTPFRIDLDGDVQRAEVTLPVASGASAASGTSPRTVVILYDEGTDAFSRVVLPEPGSASEGLRILRSRAEGGSLRLVVEGLAGRQYGIGVRTPRIVEAVPGVTVARTPGGADLLVTFEGPPEQYVRRTINLPLR